MSDLFSKCGFNCGRCPAYKENVETFEDRQRTSDGWRKYLGFRVKAEWCYCDGCQMPPEKEEGPYHLQPWKTCRIRKCAVRNGVETCAHCSRCPCEDLRDWGERREKIEARIGGPIPEEDYLTFVEAFESARHLEAIRASLSPEDIIEAKILTVESEIVDFPSDLPLSKKEASAFKALHRLLANVLYTRAETFARQAALAKRRRVIYNLLWLFGLFGRLREEDGSYLEVDAETYMREKRRRNLTRVDRYFEVLRDYGVHMELVQSEGGFSAKMSFNDSAGGPTALRALKRYAAKLDEKHGKKAIRYFSKVNMRVLSEE